VQPIGPATADQERVITLAAEFLGRYFHLPVRIRPKLPLDIVPRPVFRRSIDGLIQMHSGTVLHAVLAPRMPPDAAVYLALTAIDLYPQDDWNFVFGEASLTERVGVWSLARLGDPAYSERDFRRVLMRTLKVASHETGHMFGLSHCTAHRCNMNGSNSLSETDRAPLAPCPQCMAKICWLTGIDPSDWSRGLAVFLAPHALVDEEEQVRAMRTQRGDPAR
jgi:archaemetzincin